MERNMAKRSLKDRLKNDAVKAMTFMALSSGLSVNASAMTATPMASTETSQGISQSDDDLFDVVYDLEKKSAESLAKGGNEWLDINNEVVEIMSYWTPKQIQDYYHYKEERQKEEKLQGHWKAIRKATQEGRKEHKRIVRDVIYGD